MKISCEVIKDLLPLYQDGICSDESRKIVEEHLQSCDECRELLDNMNQTIDVSGNMDKYEEIADLKKLSKKWNRKMILSMLKGAFSALIMVAIVLIIIYSFIGIKVG
ncbi:zf-HC2 domain-containing protein [Streptococcus equi subsp. zooepidemicus]|uniref:zf-HC2 domain-containing protein n=1 Tax=Streptococcus equi TaxID=1336 RepID=UPI001E5FBCFD|nr:zf-HC2 domain-containing protein [Streptococcus equi]MCD3418819.1 zf-HC2 domain-containing protein [Streptococcus equi subsp. zooepidemicus]